ncbi:MAG: type I glyceraldehyde-3-phosphate dehydrogenase [Chloroflexia bacterium]|nr:type I glyceraldehyde-3-phosphate dehydrogenase [Chloroflexia bacterium]
MTTRVGINGFGRIGRQTYKAILEYYPVELEVVAVNDITDKETLAHLLRYDSVYGAFDGEIELSERGLLVDEEELLVFAQRDPAQLPWGELGVDIVIESTGIFRSEDKAGLHLQAGAKKVILSAPAKGGNVLTVVLGVNEDDYDPAKHHIVSNASCTTNCLAPVAKVVHDTFGITRGLMTTIHSYTADQNLVDAPHKDLRRARHAAMNIVPTTTGAAKALGLVIPDLAGKFDGVAIRVPTPTVSIIDFFVELKKAATADEINAALREASDGDLEGILLVSDEPLVSSDFIGAPFSSIVDAPMTLVIDGTMAKLMSWYDNEWGYSLRVADLASLMAEQL